MTTAPPPALDTDVAIETPEHIVFRHRVAGPARRFCAFLVDLTLCYGTVFVFVILAALAAFGAHPFEGVDSATAGVGIGVLLLVLFGVQWVYFAVLEGWHGRTPGKRAFGLLVVTTTGRPIGFRESALRNILRAADAMPVPDFAGIASVAGLVSMTLTRRFQRLGDLVAGTMVVIPEQARAAAPLHLVPPPRPHELASLPDRILLDADERLALELFLRRRHKLGRARELELAAMIAPVLARRYGLSIDDPARLLALVYDRAANAGRTEAPPSERGEPWR